MDRDDTNLPGFDDIYFPDSYLLGVRESPAEIVFDLDVYPRGKARLLFRNVRRYRWISKVMRPIHGLDPEPDYGCIHSLIGENSLYRIEGEWGELEIESDAPKVEFLK